MRVLRKILIPMTVAFVLSACGAGGESSPPPGGGGSGTGYTGTLIGNGTSQVHTWDLTRSNDWLTRLSFSNYDVVALNLPAAELFVAGLDMLDPMDVSVYDLNTFGLKRQWIWPDTVDLWRVEGLAISPDGSHAAAILSALGEPFLEVINIADERIVMTDFTAMTSVDMEWVSDTELMFAMATAEYDVPYHGAIVKMDLSDPMSGSGMELRFEVLAGFSQAEWGTVHSYRLSHDGSQLVFARAGDIWVKDLTDPEAVPHQLTTGPTALSGATFSPDGSLLALVESHPYGLEQTFVIPNHRGAPILVDSRTEAGSVWRIEDGNLMEEILVWLP